MTTREVCLQLDAGNSSAKWRLCAGAQVVSRGSYRYGDAASRTEMLDSTAAVNHIWVASVVSAAAEAQLTELLAGHWGIEPWYARTAARHDGLVNSYAQPERMGVDRWLAMLGARERERGRLCVVDAGSALTIDIVEASGQHAGGYIIPGPQLMERALLLDTDRVRFAEEASYALAPGTSTAQAVRHGIALAQAGAVELACAQAGAEPLVLLFCGGGGQALQELVGRGGEWVPDLVFEGLELLARSSS